MGIKIGASQIGLESTDEDLLTVGNAILTVAGEVQMTTLDIGGTNVTSTAAEINYLAGQSGNSAVNKAIVCDGNGDFEMQDSDKVWFGNDADVSIHWDGAMKIGTDNSGKAITIGHGTSEVNIGANLTVTGDLTVSGGTI